MSIENLTSSSRLPGGISKAELHDAGYRYVDMDSHFYEPPDCFSRHLEHKFRDDAIRPAPGGIHPQTHRSDGDIGWWSMGDERLVFMDFNLTDFAFRPGAILGLFEGQKSASELRSEGSAFRPIVEMPEAISKKARLPVLDAHNIEATMMLGSTGLLVEYDFKHRPEAMLANLRSYNRWIEDEWGFGADGRIFGVPVISMIDIDEAICELDRVAARGSRLFYFKMGPVYGRAPADPAFDSFWARVQDHGMTPVLHIDNHGYIADLAPVWGHERYRNLLEAPPFVKFISDVWRPVQDTIASLVLGDLFGRFPAIHMLVIESGSEWLPSALLYMNKAAKGTSKIWRSGHHVASGLTPTEVFLEHFSISPFPEDDIPALVHLIGAERVLFGSDWPHGEGLVDPRDYTDRLPGISTDDVKRIMRDNGARVLGLNIV